MTSCWTLVKHGVDIALARAFGLLPTHHAALQHLKARASCQQAPDSTLFRIPKLATSIIERIGRSKYLQRRSKINRFRSGMSSEQTDLEQRLMTQGGITSGRARRPKGCLSLS